MCITDSLYNTAINEMYISSGEDYNSTWTLSKSSNDDYYFVVFVVLLIMRDPFDIHCIIDKLQDSPHFVCICKSKGEFHIWLDQESLYLNKDQHEHCSFFCGKRTEPVHSKWNWSGIHCMSSFIIEWLDSSKAKLI